MTDTMHVLPVGDLIEHDGESDNGCPCGPTVVPIKAEDGSVNWIIAHHSLDGRESNERHSE